jgi:autotransporter translocation and assembly factor TamB
MRFVKWFFYTLLGLLVLVALAAGGVLLALQSESGQRWIVQKLPELTGGMVVLDTPSGSWPQDIALGRVELRDADGVWLQIDGLALRWSPWALLRKHVDVATLSAKKITVLRAPLPGEQQAETTQNSGFDLSSLPSIRVQALDIAEIEVHEAVAGYHQRLKLQGKAGSNAAGLLEANLSLTTLEGLLTRLELALAQEKQGFRGTLEAEEAAGGLLGKLLMLAPDASLRLQGEAALTGTQLQAAFIGQEAARTLLDAKITGEGIGTKTMQFAATLAGNLPGQLAADPALAELLGEEGYRLRAAITMAGEQIGWEIAELAAGPLTVQGKGSVPLTDSAALDMDIAAKAELAGLSGLAGQPLAGTASVKAVASGTLRKPSATLDAALVNVAAAGQSYPDAVLRAVLVPQEDGTLKLAPLQLSAGEVQLQGEAQFQPEDASWQAKLNLPETQFAHIAPLLPPGSMPAGWQGAVALAVDAQGKDGEIHAVVNGDVGKLRGLPDALGALLGNAVTLQAKALQNADGIAWSDTVVHSAGGIELNSAGTLKGNAIDAKAEARVKNMAVLGNGIPGGSPEVKLHATGALDALKAEATLAWAPPELPKLDGAVNALITPEWLTLEKATLTAAGAVVDAKGKYPLAGGGAALDAVVKIADLASLGRYVGQELQGRVNAVAALKGDGLTAKADIAQLSVPGVTLAAATLDASVGSIAKQENIRAVLKLADAAGEGWALNAAQLRAQSGAKAKDQALPPVAWDITAKGEAQGQPLTVAGNGAVSMEGEKQTLTIAKLAGTAMGEKFGLDQPAVLQMAPKEIALNPTTLRFGKLVVNARWALNRAGWWPHPCANCPQPDSNHDRLAGRQSAGGCEGEWHPGAASAGSEPCGRAKHRRCRDCTIALAGQGGLAGRG